MIAQLQRVTKQLIPTFIHDDTTRIVICIAGILLMLYILYEVMRYLNDQ
jgi:hypothetical protein